MLMMRSRTDSATTGVGEQRIPVDGGPVGGEDQGAVLSFGDQLVEVVGLDGGEVAHGEVVKDQDVGSGPSFEAGAPGAVGVAAGEVGEESAGLGERDAVPRRQA